MDIDLLFAVVTQMEWRSISEEGIFEHTSMAEEKHLWCFEGKDAENVLNHFYNGEKELLLVVLDPLRIQSPFKRIKQDDLELVEFQEPISLDAVIDKIKLRPDKKNGDYSLNVKHFD